MKSRSIGAVVAVAAAAAELAFTAASAAGGVAATIGGTAIDGVAEGVTLGEGAKLSEGAPGKAAAGTGTLGEALADAPTP
jgi:hypothetical protein